jgi:hypothetical protein
MMLHDWSRIEPGLFHHFHQRWTIALTDALNAGLLPAGYSALIEQRSASVEPDVLTLHEEDPEPLTVGAGARGTLAVDVTPPKTRFVVQTSADHYARKADRIAIHHPLGTVVSIIELMSPGNKHSRAALRDFVDKTTAFLAHGVHVLIVDLFPPTVRDPRRIHDAIWRDFDGAPFHPPADQPLTCVSYAAGEVTTAYVEPIAVGAPLPEMPVFLSADRYVSAPLDATYAESWRSCPASLRRTVAPQGGLA